jgi:polyisoprenoid-binding protein YceI
MPVNLQISRKTQILAGAAAGLVILIVVGGGPVAIHLVEGSSPPPLSPPQQLVGAVSPTAPSPTASAVSPAAALPATTPVASPAATATASPTAEATDGTWSVALGSVAGYRVQETLFGQSNIAVGRTSSVQGSLSIAGGMLTAGDFSVAMSTVKSDRSARDQQFQTRIMDTASYPTSRFALTQPVALGTALSSGLATLHVTGNLTLRGVTRPVTFPVTVTRSAGRVNVAGSVQITFADYSIPNPTNSVAQTGSQGVLEFSLNFTRG